MSTGFFTREQRSTRRFRVALAVTLVAFVAIPFVVAGLVPADDDYRGLVIGAMSALILLGLWIVALIVGLGFMWFNRAVAVGIVAGVAVGTLAGAASCFAVLALVA